MATPLWAMMIPAVAGPATRAKLNDTELMAMADPRSFRSTRLGTMAKRSGWLKARITPCSNTRVNSHSMVSQPATAMPHRMIA